MVTLTDLCPMKLLESTELLEESLSRAMSYQEYRKLTNILFSEGRTTGLDQSESMIRYTELNIARMNKWDKYFKIPDDIRQFLSGYKKNEIWLVISEAWCGDAAHALPIMAKLAAVAPSIDFKVVLRNENLELMDLFLTNGSRGIPKLLRLDASSLDVLSTWGPRPFHAQHIFNEAKQKGEDLKEAKKRMQIWYARNRGVSILQEIVESMGLESN